MINETDTQADAQAVEAPAAVEPENTQPNPEPDPHPEPHPEPPQPEPEPDPAVAETAPESETELPSEEFEQEVVMIAAADADQYLSESEPVDTDRNEMKAVIEAVIYITDEPLTPQQIASALNRPLDVVKEVLEELAADYARPERGLSIREVAGGYKMATKPEHHEAVRAFVKNLKPPLKLSLAALETLAVIAYKQPVTGPEIMEIRGVQGLGVLKTLIDRKLIATAGRKNVVGKPILYKTTKDFLVQFGLKDLAELPTLKEFEELGRLALSDGEDAVAASPEPDVPETAVPEPPIEEPPSTEPPQEEPTREPEPPVEPPPAEPPVEEPEPDQPPVPKAEEPDSERDA